jgi:hypothetical protein
MVCTCERKPEIEATSLGKHGSPTSSPLNRCEGRDRVCRPPSRGPGGKLVTLDEAKLAAQAAEDAPGLPPVTPLILAVPIPVLRRPPLAFEQRQLDLVGPVLRRKTCERTASLLE